MDGARFKLTPLAVLLPAMIICDLWYLQWLFTKFDDSDFAEFYYAGRAWFVGKDLYFAGQTTNLNPPVAMFLFLPFAMLEQWLAVGLWMILNFTMLGLSVSIICKELKTKISLQVLLLAGFSVPTLYILSAGNLPWILALPTTLAWRAARNNRWGAAGAWLGLCLGIKPIFLWFLLYFMLRREWKAVVSCGAVGLGLLIAGLAFGIQAYLSWFAAGNSVVWFGNAGNGSILGLVKMLGLPSIWMWTGIAGVLLITAGHLHRSDNVDQDWATVWLASLLVSPLGWVYYYWLAVGPLIATFRDIKSRILTTIMIAMCIPVESILRLLRQTGNEEFAFLFAPLGAWVTILLWALSIRNSIPTAETKGGNFISAGAS